MTLKNGFIIAVELVETIADGTVKTPENYPHPGWQAAYRELPYAVLEKQELTVDAVTGATTTSLRFNQALQRVFLFALHQPERGITDTGCEEKLPGSREMNFK